MGRGKAKVAPVLNSRHEETFCASLSTTSWRRNLGVDV